MLFVCLFVCLFIYFLEVLIIPPPIKTTRRTRKKLGDKGLVFHVTNYGSQAPSSNFPLVTGPEKLIFVCRVYIQDRDINSLEFQEIKNIKKRNREHWFLC